VLPTGSQLTFEQYLAWCPEAKFDVMDGKPEIGGWEGTRNMLGPLLSFGLTEVVRLLHPREWVAALLLQRPSEALTVTRGYTPSSSKPRASVSEPRPLPLSTNVANPGRRDAESVIGSPSGSPATTKIVRWSPSSIVWSAIGTMRGASFTGRTVIETVAIFELWSSPGYRS